MQCTTFEKKIQKGFKKSSSNLKIKKSKRDVIEIHGGKIVRSSGRKDRHSKVCTAKGLKDRRVRLSPKTAIEFYDVQDRLGYDRPSKAIDWLLKEAKSAIDALHHNSTNPSTNHSAHEGFFHQDINFLTMVNNNGGTLSSSSEIHSYHNSNGDEASLQTYQNGSILFNGDDEELFINSMAFQNYVFLQREPLQSTTLCPINNASSNMQFYSSIGFSNDHELSGFDQEQNPISSKQSSTTSFLLQD